LKRYAADFQAYEAYKNAPYPRFEVETDLMIGTEGQLGVITEMVIETAELFPVTYFFLLLPRWEEDFEPHMEIFEKVQDYREQILSCELWTPMPLATSSQRIAWVRIKMFYSSK
jgi:hypothetical protein